MTSLAQVYLKLEECTKYVYIYNRWVSEYCYIAPTVTTCAMLVVLTIFPQNLAAARFNFEALFYAATI